MKVKEHRNKQGLLHCEDGPALEFADGQKEWLLNGKYHREDGPAVENVSGYKEWWVNGKQHRLDGPAVEYTNGHKEWWVNGEYYSSKHDFQIAIIEFLSNCDKKAAKLILELLERK
jgi:hypothetical protein